MIHASINEIVRVIGLAAAVKLVESFGGTRIYLPHPSRVKPDTPVAQALGIEAACRLASEWPQCEIAIPGSSTLRPERDHAIRNEPASMPVRELAKKYGLTERQIYNVRAESDDPAPGQPAQKSAAGSRP
jgi:Mor family transcriptional regulator